MQQARVRRSRRETNFLEFIPDTAPSPRPGTSEDREFREAAERAVIELPDDLREAFTLRFWHDFGYDEIGAIQGVTAGVPARLYSDSSPPDERIAGKARGLESAEPDLAEEDQPMRE